MKFETWLRKQKHRDDRIGDLANDFIASKTKTIKESFDKFHACQAAIDSYNDACDEFLEFMTSKIVAELYEFGCDDDDDEVFD